MIVCTKKEVSSFTRALFQSLLFSPVTFLLRIVDACFGRIKTMSSWERKYCPVCVCVCDYNASDLCFEVTHRCLYISYRKPWKIFMHTIIYI